MTWCSNSVSKSGKLHFKYAHGTDMSQCTRHYSNEKLQTGLFNCSQQTSVYIELGPACGHLGQIPCVELVRLKCWCIQGASLLKEGHRTEKEMENLKHRQTSNLSLWFLLVNILIHPWIMVIMIHIPEYTQWVFWISAWPPWKHGRSSHDPGKQAKSGGIISSWLNKETLQ